MSCVDWAFIKLDEVDEGWLVNDEFKENNDAVMDPDAMNSDAFLAEILLLAKMAVWKRSYKDVKLDLFSIEWLRPKPRQSLWAEFIS